MSNSKISQVDSSKYDANYFKETFTDVDLNKRDFSQFNYIYNKMSDLVQLSKEDVVVDFGCGNGNLSFLLNFKYGGKVIGIDYSKDAIDIANAKLANMKTPVGVEFINANNDQLPELKNVKAVYFADVLEHMYQHEISELLGRIKNWSDKPITLVVHTDNNTYLNFIRPLIDLASVLSKKATIEQIQSRNKWEKERHVNLTNPNKLKYTMEQHGFIQVSLEKPEIDLLRIKAQLGPLSVLAPLVFLFTAKTGVLNKLLPGFYATYKSNN